MDRVYFYFLLVMLSSRIIENCLDDWMNITDLDNQYTYLVGREKAIMGFFLFILVGIVGNGIWDIIILFSPCHVFGTNMYFWFMVL